MANNARSPYYIGDVVGKKIAAFESGNLNSSGNQILDSDKSTNSPTTQSDMNSLSTQQQNNTPQNDMNPTSPSSSSISNSASSSVPSVMGQNNGAGQNGMTMNSTGGVIQPVMSPVSSSSSSCQIYGYGTHREPIPSSFANPLLNIEPDTRSPQEGISGPARGGQYRKAATAGAIKGGIGASAMGSAKQGIYQKSISILSNGMSPLLRKKQQQLQQQQQQQQPQYQLQQPPQRGVNTAKSPVERQNTHPINMQQSINSGNDQFQHDDESDSGLARTRRKSEPVMFNLESISDEIAKIHQRQEQIMENMSQNEFDAMMLMAQQQQQGSQQQQQSQPHQESVINSRPLPQQLATHVQPSTHPGGPMAAYNASTLNPASLNPANLSNANPYGLTYNVSNYGSDAIVRRSKVASLGRGEQLQHGSPASSSHYNSGGSKEPLYMLYDHESHRSNSRNDDQNIYEEIDFMNSLRAQYGHHDSLSLNSWKKKNLGSKRSLAPSSFTRWFSTRKKSSPSSTLTTEIDLENPYMDVKFKKQRPPISLPDPPPQGLTPEKLKRRYIIGSIVESENSYISALQRLINDYKKPLEETTPSILSQNKINTIFYRIEQLLQCHTIFGIALSQCVREWDEKERIGEVFIVSFSKPMVLDIYSDFINNFTAAMEIARKASKSKSQFAQFLHERLLSSQDRLSFFGLMVKPVQRFPQFILLLTDLLKHTPADHHDRMSLQLALTQLESLADRLNERKRDAERHFAVKQLLKDYLSNSAANNSQRYLIRQDDIYVLDLDPASGLVQKSKCRKLYLLNDMLICVALPSNKLKFAVQLQEVDVMEDVSPGAGNMLTNSSNKEPSSPLQGSNVASLQQASVEKMYLELANLMHDLELMTRITGMVASLRYQYTGLSADIPEGIALQIREEIRRKDAQITLIDKSCFQMRIRSKSYKDVVCVQMSDPELKRDFLTDVRLAKLALDRANNPAWDSVLDAYSPTSGHQSHVHGIIQPRVPLFVKSLPIFATIDNSQLTCALFYRIYHGPLLDVETGVLWICNVSEKGSQLGALATNGSDLSLIHSYELCDSHVTCLESVGSLTVWIGLRQGRIIVINANSPGEWQQYAALDVASEVTCMRHFGQHVYVGLITGIVSIFDAVSFHEPIMIELSQSPVTCLLPVNDEMYACCHNKIWVINGTEMDRSYSLVQSTGNEDEEFIENAATESELCPNLLAQSGIGLWVSLVKSPVIKLFHTETFKHLQDINVAVNVRRALNEPNTEVYITSLLATRGLLWVGTNVGIIVSLALPRLQGVPLISGSISVSLHRHLGPVNILLSLTPGADCIPHIPQNMQQKTYAGNSALSDQKSQLEDMESIYGLYSDLMNVGDYVGVKRTQQNAAMQRMAWDLSNMNISDDSTSESASSGAMYGAQALNNARMTRPLHPHPAPAIDPSGVQKPQLKQQSQPPQSNDDSKNQPQPPQPLDRRPTVTNTIYETACQSVEPVSPESEKSAPTATSPTRGLPPSGQPQKPAPAQPSTSTQQSLESQPQNGQLQPQQPLPNNASRPKSSHSNSNYGTRPTSGTASRTSVRLPNQQGSEIIYEAAPPPSSMVSAALSGKTALLLTGGNGYKRISPMNNPFLSEHAHCIIWEYKL